MSVDARTRDPEEARRQVAEVYFPHRLTLCHDPDRFEMALSATRVGPVSIGRLSYGGEVVIDADELRTGYQVNVPLEGRLRTTTRTGEVCADPRTAAVYRPDSPATLHGWAGGDALFGLKIDRRALEGQLSALIGGPVDSVVRLDGAVRLDTGPGAQWWSAARLLLELTGRGDGPLAHACVARPLVEAVMSGLLYAVGHQYRDRLDEAPIVPRPATIQRAVELIEERPGEAWTVGGLAAAVGLRARALQEGFAHHVGVPPMSYLRTVRLARVHAELRAAHPERATVAELANRWGFGHLGRFAAAYRARYGQPPSATLRQLP